MVTLRASLLLIPSLIFDEFSQAVALGKCELDDGALIFECKRMFCFLKLFLPEQIQPLFTDKCRMLIYLPTKFRLLVLRSSEFIKFQSPPDSLVRS